MGIKFQERNGEVNIKSPVMYSLDDTLTKEGYGADAKAVGEALAELANTTGEDIGAIEQELEQHKAEASATFATKEALADVEALAEIREVFVGTVATTWDELTRAYNQGKLIFLYDNGGYYILSIYNTNANPKYMSFTTFNNGIKAQDTLDINEIDKKWVFTRNSLTLKKDYDYVNGKAGNALSIAMNANDKADAVKTTADTAIVYADKAKTVANLAKSIADTATTDIDALQLLTKGIGGGGINGSDIEAGGKYYLKPNTILLCLTPQKGKLNLKGTDNNGNTINFTGYTAVLLFATVEEREGNNKFNICGICVGGSSVLSPKLDTFRYFVNTTSCYLENTGTTSAALYRDIRA